MQLYVAPNIFYGSLVFGQVFSLVPRLECGQCGQSVTFCQGFHAASIQTPGPRPLLLARRCLLISSVLRTFTFSWDTGP